MPSRGLHKGVALFAGGYAGGSNRDVNIRPLVLDQILAEAPSAHQLSANENSRDVSAFRQTSAISTPVSQSAKRLALDCVAEDTHCTGQVHTDHVTTWGCAGLHISAAVSWHH